MKEVYRGHEINVNRERSLGGERLLYYSIVRESDGYVPVDGFEDSDETEAGMVAMLRKDIDAALASDDPWDEAFERVQRAGAEGEPTGAGGAGGVNSDNPTPNPPGRRKGRARLPWHRDPVVLARLVDVERRVLAGETNTAIAAVHNVDEKTIRDDRKRIEAAWLARTKAEIEQLRAEKVAELAEIKRLALGAAAFDEMCERAVLFNEPFITSDGRRGTVYRDNKGSAQFRGNKAAAIGQARQAVMDQAKVLGLIVDKQEVGGGANLPPIRFVEVVPPDGGDAAPDAQD